MIVDVHSHAWQFPQHFGDDFRRQAARARAGVEVDLIVRYEDYRATCPPDTKTIVFGGKARLSDQWVDDRYVANFSAADPSRLIGFLSVDFGVACTRRVEQVGAVEADDPAVGQGHFGKDRMLMRRVGPEALQ